jgi:hypothetical protein
VCGNCARRFTTRERLADVAVTGIGAIVSKHTHCCVRCDEIETIHAKALAALAVEVEATA